jgi:hypothetical protein
MGSSGGGTLSDAGRCGVHEPGRGIPFVGRSEVPVYGSVKKTGQLPRAVEDSWALARARARA